MDWQDDAVVLSSMVLGTSSALRLNLLTREHGRASGMYRPAAARKGGARYSPQAGEITRARWRGRLEEHLGNWQLNPIRCHLTHSMSHAGKLQAVLATVGLCDHLLPEQHPYPRLFDACLAFIDGLAQENWLQRYIGFELVLLAELGFGLSLDRCAVTNSLQDLAYVSPKTGRAVSITGAGIYAPRLLPMPHLPQEWLNLTGFFLNTYAAQGRRLPPARDGLVQQLQALHQPQAVCQSA
jgi:DNA repair protein RecO (recombination protein O)